MTSDPVLKLPTDDGEYLLYTDWSSEGISAVLHQIQANKEFPICYKSRGCRGAEQTYGSAEGELLAAIWGIGKLRHYLQHKRFTLITDSTALASLQTTKNLTGKLARWALYLQEFRFSVRHKAGKSHGNADGTSRGPHPSEDTALFDKKLAEVWSTLEDPELWEEEEPNCNAIATRPLARYTADCNLTRQEHLRASHCDLCGHSTSQGRSTSCGRCRLTVHLRCLPRVPPNTYWYCDNCQSHLNPADPAEDVPL